MRMRRWCAVVAAAAAVAGCGGGSDPDPAEDRQIARTAMEALEERLREADFESAPPDDDEDDNDLTFESEECEDFREAFPEDDDELPGETASEEADFERGELDAEGGTEETVDAALVLVEDEGELDELFDLYRDDRLAGCLEEAMQAEFENQADASADEGVALEVADLRVAELGLAEIGDETAGFTVDATLSAAGFEFPFHIELAVARSGRTAALLVVSTIGDDEGSVSSEDLLSLLIDEATGE